MTRQDHAAASRSPAGTARSMSSVGELTISSAGRAAAPLTSAGAGCISCRRLSAARHSPTPDRILLESLTTCASLLDDPPTLAPGTLGGC
jgi:hypothetical protein